jgi:hypothetical protein
MNEHVPKSAFELGFAKVGQYARHGLAAVAACFGHH